MARAIVLGPNSPLRELVKARVNAAKPQTPESSRKKRKRKPRASRLEHHEQVDFFQWCEAESVRTPELAEFFAIPNGARTAMSVAKRLKAEGVKAGYPDIGLDIARGGWHGLRLETKRTDARPSDVKPDQLAWHLRLTKRGYRVVVCKGVEELKAAALAYLALPPTRVVPPHPPVAAVAKVAA